MYSSARSTQMPMSVSVDGRNGEFASQQSFGAADQHMCGRAMDAITLHVGPDNSVTVSSGDKPPEIVALSSSREHISRGSISSPMSPRSAHNVGSSGVPGVPGISSYRILGQSGQLSDRQTVAIQNGLTALANMLGGVHEQAVPGQTRLPGQLAGREFQGQDVRGKSELQSFQGGNVQISGQQQSGLPRTSFSGGSPTTGARVPSGTAVLGANMERLNLGSSNQPYSVMQGLSRPETRSPVAPAQTALSPKTPLVLSQTVNSSAKLAPQMQELIRNGLSGYTASVAVVLMPNDNKLY